MKALNLRRRTSQSDLATTQMLTFPFIIPGSDQKVLNLVLKQKTMSRIIINTPNAPAPVGAYNQAIVHNGVLYASGQIALDPATGELLTSDIEAETRRVMDNLGAVLEAGGSSFANVIRCSVFISDMENFGRINTVYASYFDEATAPARALVEVANLPKYVNVEISCIAAVG